MAFMGKPVKTWSLAQPGKLLRPRHSWWCSSNQPSVRFWKSEVSVTSDGSHSKANLAQVARQLGRSIKPLDVCFLASPIMSSDVASNDKLRQKLRHRENPKHNSDSPPKDDRFPAALVLRIVLCRAALARNKPNLKSNPAPIADGDDDDTDER
jgi:hypothetical protein